MHAFLLQGYLNIDDYVNRAVHEAMDYYNQLLQFYTQKQSLTKQSLQEALEAAGQKVKM